MFFDRCHGQFYCGTKRLNKGQDITLHRMPIQGWPKEAELGACTKAFTKGIALLGWDTGLDL